MLQIIRYPINHQISFSTPKGDVLFSHPTAEDIPTIIALLQKEGLDVRRLTGTVSDSFLSIGSKRIAKEWNDALRQFVKRFPDEGVTVKDILIQSAGMRAYGVIPRVGKKIVDPFHMHEVEDATPIESLVSQQLENSTVAKVGGAIVSFGRLLDVEGNVELVSLWTHKSWRQKGLASKIIQELLFRTMIRPIYSFQQLELVPFYLRQYGIADTASVCTFEELPNAQQRDLFYMNIFWGPYVIIKIG